MKRLSEKQIKTLMRLVVRAENESITESGAAVYGELHSVLVDMLEVLPTNRAADLRQSRRPKVGNMKLSFDEIVELIHREMYVRNGVMLGEKAAAKAILQAEEAAQQQLAPDGAVCPECSGRDGYHKTGCKLWLWEPRPAQVA